MTKYEILVAKINELGNNEFVEKVNREGRKWIMEHTGCNAGEFSKALQRANEELSLGMTFEQKVKAESDGTGDKPARARKAKGCLPLRVQNWVIRKIDLDDDDEIPEVTTEVVEGFIIADNANWNLLIGKLGEEELASFEAWLGEPCTMTRRRDAEEQGVESQKAKKRAKAAAYLKKAALAADMELWSAIHELAVKFDLDLL